LEAKLNNSDGDLQVPREKLIVQRNKAEALEDELNAARKQHTELAKQEGTLKAEYDVRRPSVGTSRNSADRFFQAQQERIAEREILIQKTSEKFKIKGFSSSGLDGEKVVEFKSKLDALWRKQKGHVESLQVISFRSYVRSLINPNSVMLELKTTNSLANLPS
jgi:phage shock protein A